MLIYLISRSNGNFQEHNLINPLHAAINESSDGLLVTTNYNWQLLTSE